jgi:Heterokaryon incompatibility protein (HET)
MSGVLCLRRENIDDLMSIGALGRIRHQLPLTIRDAIDLVRVVDECYIWVDSLCLIEDDPDALLSGAEAMDIIYEAYTLTIIAATWTDANSGLPGLRFNSRKVEQFVEEIDSGFSVMVCQGLTRALDNSKYSTRGWT